MIVRIWMILKPYSPYALPDLELEPEEEDELDCVLHGQHCGNGDWDRLCLA